MGDEKQKRTLVENSKFFKGFDSVLIDAIAPKLTPCFFPIDNAICFKGDESDCLYLISKGQAEVSVSSQDGKIIVLGNLTDGDAFGEIGLLDKGSRTANVVAKTDVHLYRLATKDFNDIAKGFGLKEWAAITAYICMMFRSVTSNLEETTFLDTGNRVLKKILDIHDRSSEQEKQAEAFQLNISQETLGRMIGLSREATNKILSRFAEDGLIERKYKHILVPDIARLRKRVETEEF